MTASVSLQGKANIMIKGKLLFSYNEHGYTSEHKKEYDEKYHKFQEKIEKHLKEINPENRWESDVQPTKHVKKDIMEKSILGSKVDEETFKFKIVNGQDFLIRFTRWEDPDEFFLPAETNIYTYGREGLFVEHLLTGEKETKTYVSLVMKACKTGFHRDWNHDAVCVQNRGPPFSDVDRAEDAYERAHDRAIKRHQDYAESGGEY